MHKKFLGSAGPGWRVENIQRMATLQWQKIEDQWSDLTFHFLHRISEELVTLSISSMLMTPSWLTS